MVAGRKTLTPIKKCPQKIIKNVESALGSLLGEDTIFIPRLLGMRLLRLLSSHSSMLMLNFQNFYITKGPTTSAGEIPCKYKIRGRERLLCRGKHVTASFCPLREAGVSFSRAIFGILRHFIRSREESGGSWIRENVSHLSGTGSRCGGIFNSFLFTPHEIVSFN